MKKRIAIFTILCMCSASLFALDLSAGFGGNFTANFTNWDTEPKNLAESINSTLVGGGFYGFFDATFVELNVGLLFGKENLSKTPKEKFDNYDKGITVIALKLGLFGKYPINLDAFTIFPMLGIDGQIGLGGEYYGEDYDTTFKFNSGGYNYSTSSTPKVSDLFNQFWFKLGVGADIPVALDGKLYIRPSFLYGIRLNTKFENDYKEYSNIKSIVGHGLDIRVAIGYKSE